MLEFSIITISTFVTLLNECTKYFASIVFKKDIKEYIPIFSVLFGVTLGVIGFYLPDVAMGNNIVEAVFIGISAGAAATGVNQIGKQLNKLDTNSTDAGALDVLNGDAVDNYLEEQVSDVVDSTEECSETNSEE